MRNSRIKYGAISSALDFQTVKERFNIHICAACADAAFGGVKQAKECADFVDDRLHRIISSRPAARAYRVILEGDSVVETELTPDYLG